MVSKRRKRVAFTAKREVTKPIRVRFTNPEGETVSFKAHKKYTKRVRVNFLAKRSKKK